ncbi:hypothetical protein PGTUg99_024351 [Puccinia graminis f. sp. tritici]|uniref:Uncharacterized protein n=1 Tax=Puccinia graminis f. sp. tritici TaxID=56615 RepID=A0A5B0MH91_PUCGR|nr:hypothetical protein PGTUg99_024351 [Puccinia graminis f. sp. tritici]
MASLDPLLTQTPLENINMVTTTTTNTPVALGVPNTSRNCTNINSQNNQRQITVSLEEAN